MNKSRTLIPFLLITASILLIFTNCSRFSGNSYHSKWERYPDTRWAGPELWANRLADWEIKEGRLTCNSTLPLRTVHLLTRRVTPEEGSIQTLVRIARNNNGLTDTGSAAGILLGAGSQLDYRSASLIFHSWGEGAGYFIGVDGSGKVFIRDLSQENSYVAYAKKAYGKWNEVILKTTAEISEGGFTSLNVIAVNPVTRIVISELKDVKLLSSSLTGNIALVSHSGNNRASGETFSFSHWSVRGSRLASFNERNIGPLVTAQYTLSRNTLKLTAQLMPVEKELCDSVEFQFYDEDSWQTILVSPVDTPSYTSSFRMERWTESSDRPFRLMARYRYGRERQNILSGVIKHDPADREEIKVLSMSCIEQVIKPDPEVWKGIDAGYFPFDRNILFPHVRQTDNMKRHNADLLFFAGDQVYESASPTAAETGSSAILDYLYKWYLWCITYSDLTTRIPSVTIPDDHDVYHGNLWGCEGRPTPPGLSGMDAQDAGGYKMSARFVNMVQATQTSHLPDAADPMPVEQNIGVYFTECNVGGVSFAVIEDRKFKSAPRELLPDAMIENGWSQNPAWNPKRRADVPGATLLGERQYAFLESWVNDWSGETWMKAVLSQTLWANMATLPDSATNDNIVPYLSIPDTGVYVRGDKIAADFDSDGWPQSGRNRAIKTIRKAFALHICGDQHLPSTIQYGTDQWGDAGYAIVSPATGNIFPRRWFPPVPGRNRQSDAPEYTGDFEDGFGNKISVVAVANPHKSSVKPERQNELSTGYSSITFNRTTREIELANWPGYANPYSDKPFPGWPVRISQSDNYRQHIVAWLPEIVCDGMTNPVIRIIREYNNELVYTVRINGNAYQPGVSLYGLYTIEVGDPDNDIWQKTEHVAAWTTKERQNITLVF